MKSIKITLAIFSVVFLSGSLVSVNAQSSTFGSKEGPQMTFETTVIDYGSIQRGSEGTRKFTFTNTGSSPVVVSNVRTTCGCTVPSYPETPIMPGETQEIEVKYDTNRMGRINRFVTVMTNIDEQIRLQITGEVVE